MQPVSQSRCLPQAPSAPSTLAAGNSSSASPSFFRACPEPPFHNPPVRSSHGAGCSTGGLGAHCAFSSFRLPDTKLCVYSALPFYSRRLTTAPFTAPPARSSHGAGQLIGGAVWHLALLAASPIPVGAGLSLTLLYIPAFRTSIGARRVCSVGVIYTGFFSDSLLLFKVKGWG